MLEDSPPPGTRVIFLKDNKYARKDDLGTLIRPKSKYVTEDPADKFKVEFLGYYFVVQRRDIKRAY